MESLPRGETKRADVLERTVSVASPLVRLQHEALTEAVPEETPAMTEPGDVPEEAPLPERVDTVHEESSVTSRALPSSRFAIALYCTVRPEETTFSMGEMERLTAFFPLNKE